MSTVFMSGSYLREYFASCPDSAPIGRILSVCAAEGEENIPASMDPYFRRCRVTEEVNRAGSSAVGARLKNADKVADFSARKPYRAAQCIKRGAEGTNNVNRFIQRSIELTDQGDGIVALDRLAQVTGGGQMVIHTAV